MRPLGRDLLFWCQHLNYHLEALTFSADRQDCPHQTRKWGPLFFAILFFCSAISPLVRKRPLLLPMKILSKGMGGIFASLIWFSITLNLFFCPWRANVLFHLYEKSRVESSTEMEEDSCLLTAKKAEGKQRVTAEGMGFSSDDGNVLKQILARTARAEIFTPMATKFSSLRVNLIIHE